MNFALQFCTSKNFLALSCLWFAVLKTGVVGALSGSAFVEFGNTKVICCMCEYLFVLNFFYNFIIFILDYILDMNSYPFLKFFSLL